MLALGIALATFGCFNFSGWLNYDQITTSSNLKIQQEQIAKEKLALAAVKNKYEKFDKFYELVSLLAEFNSKDEKAVTILHNTNYLEKTLKDKKEEVLVLNIKPEYMSDCAKDDQQCYRDPKTKDRRAYSGFYKASDGSFVISLKKML